MVNTLHEQLLDEIKSMFEVVHRPPSVGVGRHLAALRAVVELHAPGEPRLAEYGFAFECEACSNGDRYGSIEYPCSTVKAVASALGVETAE